MIKAIQLSLHLKKSIIYIIVLLIVPLTGYAMNDSLFGKTKELKLPQVFDRYVFNTGYMPTRISYKKLDSLVNKKGSGLGFQILHMLNLSSWV